jgi:FkbM family methyltransferase
MNFFTNVVSRSVSLIPWRLRTVVKDIPVVASLQRSIVNRFLANRRFVHVIDAGPAAGLRYPLAFPQDKLIWTGTYEAHLSSVIASSVREGAVCYDIGAYRGFFSGVMACQGAAEVHAFEPFPDNCEQIRSVQRENPLLPIRLHQCAVGEVDRETEFVVMTEASMGKLGDSTFDTGERGTRRISVRERTIDSMIAAGELPRGDIVKIDVEGAEAMVLRGAKKLMRTHAPLLFIEAHSHSLSRDCVEILQAEGYRITVLETSASPDFEHEPAVCHLIASPVAPGDGHT